MSQPNPLTGGRHHCMVLGWRGWGHIVFNTMITVDWKVWMHDLDNGNRSKTIHFVTHNVRLIFFLFYLFCYRHEVLHPQPPWLEEDIWRRKILSKMVLKMSISCWGKHYMRRFIGNFLMCKKYGCVLNASDTLDWHLINTLSALDWHLCCLIVVWGYQSTFNSECL